MPAGLSLPSLVLLGAIAGLYLRGLARPRLIGGPVSGLRHAGIAVALALWAVTFNGPLAAASHRLFSLHQAGHLGLRLVAPLVFVLAEPWPVLAAGLPRRARAPLRALARALRPFRRLPLALALLVAWFYLWHLPALHEAALTSPALTALAHLGMAATGANFLACLLDRSDSPTAHLQAPRILAATLVILSNILLGSLTTLKESVIYPGYDAFGGRGGFAPLADESAGGFIIWMPSSAVMIVAILFIVTRWNAAEVRRWENRHALMRRSNAAALEFPETAAELRLKVADPNRRVAGALATTSLSIFLVVMATAMVIVSLW